MINISDLFNFKTENKSFFNIGDLIDFKNNEIGMIYETELDKENDEWKYKVLFPKLKAHKFFYEKRIRYFLNLNKISIMKVKENEVI